jgi:hypothetical protein
MATGEDRVESKQREGDREREREREGQISRVRDGALERFRNGVGWKRPSEKRDT